MGLLARRIRKIALLVSALINSVLPVVMVSGLNIPMSVVLISNISASICMVVYLRADDMESIVSQRVNAELESRASTHAPDDSSMHTAQSVTVLSP